MYALNVQLHAAVIGDMNFLQISLKNASFAAAFVYVFKILFPLLPSHRINVSFTYLCISNTSAYPSLLMPRQRCIKIILRLVFSPYHSARSLSFSRSLCYLSSAFTSRWFTNSRYLAPKRRSGLIFARAFLDGGKAVRDVNADPCICIPQFFHEPRQPVHGRTRHTRLCRTIDFAANFVSAPKNQRLGRNCLPSVAIRPIPLRSVRFGLTNCGGPEILITTDKTRYTSRLQRRWSRIALLSMCQTLFSTWRL